MYPDPASLDDPKLAGELFLCHSPDEGTAKVLQVAMRERFRRPQNGDARVS
jgi:hypothetical protein